MKPVAFWGTARKHYANVLYTNVRAAIRMFFHPFTSDQATSPPSGHMMSNDTEVLDVCSGPGTTAKIALEEGYRVTLVDCRRDFLDHAYRNSLRKYVNRGLVFTAGIDVCDRTGLHSLECYGSALALFVNASGYFSLSENTEIFRHLSAKRVITNFLVLDDQHKGNRGPLFVRKRDTKFFYDIGDDEGLLALNAFTRQKLGTMFKRSGYNVDAEFIYDDFKRERLFLLSK